MNCTVDASVFVAVSQKPARRRQKKVAIP